MRRKQSEWPRHGRLTARTWTCQHLPMDKWVEPSLIVATLALAVSILTPIVGHFLKKRREATQWVVTGGGSGGSATDWCELGIHLRNVGGRPAYGIRVHGIGCKPIVSDAKAHHKDEDFDDPGRRQLALCEVDNQVLLRVAFSSHDWDTAAVKISWRGHPTEGVTTRIWPLRQFKDFDRLLERMGGVPATRRRAPWGRLR